MQTIDFLHFFCCCKCQLCGSAVVFSLLSCLVFSTWMANSSGLLLHHCWSRLACQHVAFPWRSPRLMRNFHSVSATTSLAGKASFERCCRTCSSKSKQLIRSCSTNAFFVVNDDEKYGNKEVISVTPHLYDYILANVREPEVVNLFPISYHKFYSEEIVFCIFWIYIYIYIYPFVD